MVERTVKTSTCVTTPTDGVSPVLGWNTIRCGTWTRVGKYFLRQWCYYPKEEISPMPSTRVKEQPILSSFPGSGQSTPNTTDRLPPSFHSRVPVLESKNEVTNHPLYYRTLKFPFYPFMKTTDRRTFCQINGDGKSLNAPVESNKLK